MTNPNLYSLFQQTFSQQPDAVAVETEDGRTWTFGELEAHSARMANWLTTLGLQPGDRVMVQVEKSVPALVLYLACLRAGVVYVPLNVAYQAAELAYFMENAEPRLVVGDPAKHDVLRELTQRLGVAHLATMDASGQGSAWTDAQNHAAQHRVAAVAGSDVAAILYTSGTTGRSKGAQLTHDNLASNVQTLHRYWGWQPDDVLIHALPIFHVHGLFVAAHLALLNGSPMLWMARFTPAQVLQWLPRATVFMGVPTLYVRLLQEPALSPAVCARMRLFISGSAPLLTETFHAWQARTGHTILERYGMSETLMLTSNPYDPAEGPRLAGTVGRPLPGVQVRVVNESGTVCATGDIGGVEVRGPNVFPGYWRMPDVNAKEFTPDGWFRTGDMGFVDAQGYLTLVGRSKDLIITGGYNVYPAEVESYLNELEGVEESAVIGCPHPDLGEGVVAVVVARPGATLDPDALLAAVKNRIAGFKVPKRLFVVDQLPRNVMGKVQKNLLRQRYADAFRTATS
ncbi:Long-chain-fatty-acid--CoA ligase [Tepidimonas thermarum]|uniref:Long-chain-fatty-acid--CoA ligase n=2 Tax=Tepidimonas thermarum TaxID=335431 RepID=A0A554X2T2_9BURK|nr:malonyl-CoA synthase [Tepidimonas thermarum]TSE30138.1 Long-chain-fatty-acid--CoA ligase [Tepidimonas thermarum]